MRAPAPALLTTLSGRIRRPPLPVRRARDPDQPPLSPMHALLVDDDADFRTFCRLALKSAQIDATERPGAAEALDLLDAEGESAFDIILLDLQMPGGSGHDLLYDIREKGDALPVIIISGVSDVEERVKGLRGGADDFMVKPVDADELIERIRAVVRRRNSLSPIEYGALHFDLAHRRVKRDGKPCNLSPREYDLLLRLARGAGNTVKRDDLLADVWDLGFDPGTNVLDVHIGRLRKKIDKEGDSLIETIRGVGYRLQRV